MQKAVKLAVSKLKQKRENRSADHVAVPQAYATDQRIGRCLPRRWYENKRAAQRSHYMRVDHVGRGHRDSA